MPFISVVTPVYKAADIVDELHRQLVSVLETITEDYEIIMVNDGCPAGSGEKIAALARKDPKLKFVDLARNFGQHIAISAGIAHASGDYIVVMDCDLQDPPQAIPAMLQKLRDSGGEVIFAERINRKENIRKKFYSRAFNYCIRKISDEKNVSDRDTGNFSIITNKVAKEFCKFGETKRNYGSIIGWLGFDLLYEPVECASRYAGESSYTFFKSIKHALSITLFQSVKPLFISIFFGSISAIACICFGAYLIYNFMAGDITAPGYFSLMFIVTLIGAMLFFTLAIMSVYIANIFQEQHNRPLFVVKRTINLDK